VNGAAAVNDFPAVRGAEATVGLVLGKVEMLPP